MPAPLSADLSTRIHERVRAFPRRPVAARELTGAAVAIVVTSDRFGRPSFLLTRRAPTLRRNAGQWALPGGRREPGETAVGAALRELSEELGVGSSLLEEAGLLDDYPTRSGYLITPVVLTASRIPRLRPNPAEVAAAYRIPLAVLAADGMPVIDARGASPLIRLRIRGSMVNAPTAAILHQFAEVVLHGRHTRVGHYDQPEFTWT